MYIESDASTRSLCIRNTFRVLSLQIEFAAAATAPSKQPPVIREQLQDTEICALCNAQERTILWQLVVIIKGVVGVDCLLGIYNYSAVLIYRSASCWCFLCGY
jgi:hypothetical protein